MGDYRHIDQGLTVSEADVMYTERLMGEGVHQEQTHPAPSGLTTRHDQRLTHTPKGAERPNHGVTVTGQRFSRRQIPNDDTVLRAPCDQTPPWERIGTKDEAVLLRETPKWREGCGVKQLQLGAVPQDDKPLHHREARIFAERTPRQRCRDAVRAPQNSVSAQPNGALGVNEP